jgi:acetate kinase
VTVELLKELESLQSLDPLHMPRAIAAIRQALAVLPDAVQVACFDTAFFHNMPRDARTLPIPSADPLLRGYGFHGLSYEYVCRALGPNLRPRTIAAHLGNGASVAAIFDGKPVASTMAFSPLSGIIMSTRPGDLDPGVLLYLLERDNLSVPQMRDMLETQSGLRAISGGESDVRVLCERSDDAAVFAVQMFVRSVARAIAAHAVDLGGVDLLVFTGGIGTHNDRVRKMILARLAFLQPAAAVEVLETDENLIVAAHTVTAVR